MPYGMWNLPGPGIESVSPALAGVFFTNGPPGKSLALLFKKKKIFIYFWLCWLFIAAHGRPLVAVSRDCSLVAVLRLLIAVASLVVEHRLWVLGLR